MNEQPFELVDEPSSEDMSFLGDRLYDFNVGATGISDGVLLGIFMRDDDGVMTAGLHGHTWGGTCEISRLWVSETLRHQGIGSRARENGPFAAIPRLEWQRPRRFSPLAPPGPGRHGPGLQGQERSL